MVVLARELSHTANHALLAIIVSIMTVYQESVLEATSVLKRLRNPFHVGLVHIILTNEQLTQLTVYHAQLVQIVLKEVLMIGRDTYVLLDIIAQLLDLHSHLLFALRELIMMSLEAQKSLTALFVLPATSAKKVLLHQHLVMQVTSALMALQFKQHASRVLIAQL